jgi:hypothetical protein
MVLKIVVVAAVLVALLVIAKEERLFARAGVVGSCEVVRSPIGDSAEWRACREGWLTGYPTLLGDSCTLEARRGVYQYWRCPDRRALTAPY